MLGELPVRTSMRCYYKLEDTNDASGNGNTLTNQNSVTFSAGKFSNGANFGTSGTNKGLTITTNVLSALKVANFTVSLWFKLNTTSNPSNGRFLEITTASTSSGCNLLIYYNIASGTLSLKALNDLTTTDATINFSYETANTTSKHNLIIVKTSTTKLDMYVDGILVATNTGSGTETSASDSTYKLVIGNRSLLATGAWATIDEVIIEERLWSAIEIRKYYSQGRGFLAIS